MTFTIHIHYLLIVRMRRFIISILSLITLFLSACTQKDNQGLDKQNKVQYLRISAEVKAGCALHRLQTRFRPSKVLSRE